MSVLIVLLAVLTTVGCVVVVAIAGTMLLGRVMVTHGIWPFHRTGNDSPEASTGPRRYASYPLHDDHHAREFPAAKIPRSNVSGLSAQRCGAAALAFLVAGLLLFSLAPFRPTSTSPSVSATEAFPMAPSATLERTIGDAALAAVTASATAEAAAVGASSAESQPVTGSVPAVAGWASPSVYVSGLYSSADEARQQALAAVTQQFQETAIQRVDWPVGQTVDPEWVQSLVEDMQVTGESRELIEGTTVEMFRARYTLNWDHEATWNRLRAVVQSAAAERHSIRLLQGLVAGTVVFLVGGTILRRRAPQGS